MLINCALNLFDVNYDLIWCLSRFFIFWNDWLLKRRIRAFVLTFCTLNWYNITKLYCHRNLNHLICRLIHFLIVMKYLNFLWSVNIFVDKSVVFNSKRYCSKQGVILSSNSSEFMFLKKMRKNEINYRFAFAKTFFRLRCLKSRFSNNIIFFHRSNQKSTFSTFYFWNFEKSHHKLCFNRIRYFFQRFWKIIL